ncbi:MAG: hypothetical protein Q8R91_00815 [Candidatus Omnitrophota bacterium]|nr:hypothetical protein [Candidatus Omnitrophota bacterium]
MEILRTCKEGEDCTCIVGQFEKLGIMTALKRLEKMGVTDLRMQCGDYRHRICFLMNGQDKRQRDVCVLAPEIKRNPNIFPEVLVFPELFPNVVDPQFSMRNR